MRYIYGMLLILFCLGSGFGISACKKNTQGEENRYVVLSPEVAEILAAIGATDRIVGLTEECTHPEELLTKEIVGKFGMLNREKIVSLDPGIIFSSALEQKAVAEEFTKLGYRVETVYPRTVAEMFSEIERLGKITGLEENASALITQMRSEYDTVQKQSEGLSRPKVYLEIYRDPLMSVSDQSFVGELIEVAGGDNIFSVLERDYSRIKAEDVINAAPDIIICYSQDSLSNILNRKGWQRIPAIQNKQVYFEADLNPDWIQRAGPRTVLGIKRLQEIISTVRETNATPIPQNLKTLKLYSR